MSNTLVVTGGGSGGHTSAASSVIQCLWQQPDFRDEIRVVWITSHHGVETAVAADLNIEHVSITTGKLHRSLNRRSVPDLIRVPLGILQAWRLLGKLKPALIFSTGGFVAVPVVIGAALRRIPVVIHEQTLAVGLANLISAKFAGKVLLSYPESQRFFPAQKCMVTGCPVRPEIFSGSKAKAVELFNLSAALPTLYITGGAQGARAINRAVGEILPGLLGRYQVIHQCGTLATDFGFEWLDQVRIGLPQHLQERYRLSEYLSTDSIGHVFKLADLIIGRSGAGTTAEIIALNKPCLLIPYPHATKNEQYLNASMLERRGLGQVIREEELTPERLLQSIHKRLDKTPMTIPKSSETNVDAVSPAELIAAEIIKMM